MTQRRLAILLFCLAVFIAIVACNSTACQSDANLIQWLHGAATAQPCPWP